VASNYCSELTTIPLPKSVREKLNATELERWVDALEVEDEYDRLE